LFVLSVAYLLLNAASYDGEISRTDAWRPYAGHLMCFMSVWVVVTKILTFFQKCVQICPDFCCRDLRSVGATAGSRPIPDGWLAGWLQQRAGQLQWRSMRVAIWSAHCLFTNVGRWPKRAGCMKLPRANQATKSSYSGPTGRNSLFDIFMLIWSRRNLKAKPSPFYADTRCLFVRPSVRHASIMSEQLKLSKFFSAK